MFVFLCVSVSFKFNKYNFWVSIHIMSLLKSKLLQNKNSDGQQAIRKISNF